MKTIYKYALRVGDTVSVTMPEGAQVLTAQTQNETPCLWAEVDTDKLPVSRKFEIRGTGHPLDGTEGRYVGTLQFRGGLLVFHVFESTRK